MRIGVSAASLSAALQWGVNRWPVCPQQTVQLFAALAGRCIDQHPGAFAGGASKPCGDRPESILRAMEKGDLRHPRLRLPVGFGARLARSIRKWESKGTGRPVAPSPCRIASSAGDVEVRPAVLVCKTGEEACRGDGAGRATADVRHVGEVAFQLFLIVIPQRQLPGTVIGFVASVGQFLCQSFVVG